MKTNQDPTDSQLILQYRKGDSTVLPTLVKRYHKIFCEKAYWITKDRESAKDIAQESWIKIISKLDTLKDLSSFKSWAFRIVYNKAIDAIKNISKESKYKASLAGSEASLDSSEDGRLHKQKALLTAIEKLPKEKQDIIRLFYAEEYSIAEIGSFLNIPVGTVKSRLFKAREKLKSILKK